MNKWRSWQEQQLQTTTSTMNHKKHWYLLLLLFEAKSSFIELSSVRNSSWCLLWLVETKWFCHNKCSLDNYALCLQTCMPSSLLVNCAHSAWIEVFQASMLQHFSPFAAKPSAFAFLQCILSRLRWLSVPEILEAQQGLYELAFKWSMATLHLAKASETDMSKPGMALGKLNGTWNTALFPSMVCRIKEHRSTRNRRGTGWWCWSRPWMVMKRNPEYKTK